MKKKQQNQEHGRETLSDPHYLDLHLASISVSLALSGERRRKRKGDSEGSEYSSACVRASALDSTKRCDDSAASVQIDRVDLSLDQRGRGKSLAGVGRRTRERKKDREMQVGRD